MTPAQKKAISDYRTRQREKGLVRVEVNVPENDKPLIRFVAENLRAGGQPAEEIRTLLQSLLNPYKEMDLKELLENMPPEDLELERSGDAWKDRDIEW